MLVLHGLMNTISTRLLAWVSTFSAAWHILGSTLLVILLPVVAPTHQTGAFVFTEFQTSDLDTTGERTSVGCPLLSCWPVQHLPGSWQPNTNTNLPRPFDA